jgi:hypothetical protein
MNTPTLSQLADIGAKASRKAMPNTMFVTVDAGSMYYAGERQAREAFAKAVLDAVGYKLPVDPDREAFERWHSGCPNPEPFDAWKAGREELRKEVCSDKCEDTKTEPVWTPWHGDECPMKWIPWHGDSKSPITGARTRYEIQYRDGARTICTHNTLRWSHNGTAGDIIAYRIIY